jgi:alcohol dehydrogenase YqhD (iron-dependent ADH family)
MNDLPKKLQSLISQWPQTVTIVFSQSQEKLLESIISHCQNRRRIQKLMLRGEPDSAWILEQSVEGKIVVGLGAGSVMDAAKVLSLQPQNESELISLFHQSGLKPQSIVRKTRLCLIPSHFSSGAWAARTAVISHNHQKMTILSPSLLPDQCLILPELALSISPKMRINSSYDTVSHWLELYSHVPESEKLWLRSLEGWIEDFTVHLKTPDCPRLFSLSQWLYSDSVPLTISSWPLHVLAHSLDTSLKFGHAQVMATLLPLALKSYPKVHSTGKLLAKQFLKSYPVSPLPLSHQDIQQAIQRAYNMNPYRQPDWQPYFDSILDSVPQKP